jgi:hypothetical protein
MCPLGVTRHTWLWVQTGLARRKTKYYWQRASCRILKRYEFCFTRTKCWYRLRQFQEIRADQCKPFQREFP